MRIFCVFFLILISVLAILAPWLFDYDFNNLSLSTSLQTPDLSNFLGRDENGQDLFIKIVYGARSSLAITVIVITISVVLGLIMGTLAGMQGEWVDKTICACIDMVLAFPKFLLALTLLAMIPASFWSLVFALSFSTWAGFARLVRAEVKHLKRKEFVLSARAQGASGFFLVRRYMWPHLFNLLAVHSVFQSAAVLLSESGLSFLGLGIMDEVSLGMLIQSGRRFLLEAPHLIIFPSLVLSLFLFSLNVAGDFLRDYFNPKLRNLK